MNTLKLCARAALLTLALCGANAHAAWPQDRPIEFLVAYAPGGSTDVMARAMQPFLEKRLDAKIVIVNRPGAAGEIAYTALSKAKPDGYTFAFINTPGFVSTRVQRKVGYEEASIRPVARIVDDPTVLAVPNDSSYKSLDDFIQAAKAAPGKLSVGTSGVGTDDHLMMVQLEQLTGITLTHVPFAGASESATALMGGHISSAGQNISELSDDSKYRVLAQFSSERMPQEPELPTAKEQGVDLVMTSERGIAAPAKVPDDIEKRMAHAVKAVLEDPAFLKKAQDLSLPIAYLSGEDWQKGLDEQKTRYQALWDKSPWVK
ncbi:MULTISPECIES: tripartite tricarboxylate transporter substrate binding protein [unclassified Pseudomonas]|uniref:tripartite tricarboxylate transporter substrate binding protein n=1 Tax=unclassified Pseudomonas TaxID=196821 RepID=UPI00047FCF36|nr:MULTISPECIES: tripartite tricarboxylate transporter substrate binding protein [unclassified Pseudomonas]MBD9397416.1 tripartite tricarboxylate transporter substrate binding protein [Pseudomonas sp. PDM11]MBV7563800.1 tripartite tricarboxylate transporter substrate binding protein [Pseudomonas sp. sia0905]PZW68747.1 tripartite-type tricarboxylate transporter receptor subunit TctC [Pseudomonas sp. URMO17WK12:I1]